MVEPFSKLALGSGTRLWLSFLIFGAKRNEGDMEGSICRGCRRQKSPRFREKKVVKYMESDDSILDLS